MIYLALIVMFNNFFHDLATGIWFSSMFITVLLNRWVEAEKSDAVRAFFSRKAPVLLNVNLISLGFVFAFGVTRALAYYSYEYLPAAGKGQVLALVVKHVFLLTAAGIGLYWQYSMRKELKHLILPPDIPETAH